MKRMVLLVGVIVLVAAFPGISTATNGVSCGSTVYDDVTLTHDLVDCPVDGLVAGASGITINLGGYTIDGVPGSEEVPPAAGGVRVPPGVNNVTILNGTITQFTEGVVLDTTTGNNVSRLTITETTRGINLANAWGNTVEKNHITTAFLDGIRVNGASSDSNVVTQNVVTQSNFIGITVSDFADDNLVEKNQVHGARFGIALFVGAQRNTVARNDVSGLGIISPVGQDVSGAWETGIQVDAFSNDTIVARNQVDDSGVGIFIKASVSGALVARNDVFANVSDGIRIGAADGAVERNQVFENGGWGINLLSGSENNTVTSNNLHDNGAGAILDNGINNSVG